MPSRKLSVAVATALVLAPLVLVAAACSRSQEQAFLNQFFRAARARDNASVAMMSAVEFDPRVQGEVTDFEITSISDERRSPLDYKTLLAAEQKAVADQMEFRKKKIEYQNANMKSLEEIVQMERDPAAKFNAAQAKMKAEWDKWRADTTMHEKTVSAAKAAIRAQTGPAEASLAQPGQPPFAVDKFQGELVSKDVTLNADIRMPDGQTTQKQLVVTIQRVEGTQDGTQRTGKPVIARIQGV
jgi:hypothetical protein